MSAPRRGPLTKADILRGANAPIEVEIDGLGPVLIRPLTDGEYQQAKNLTLKAITASADMDTLKKQAGGPKGAGGVPEGMQINLDVGTMMTGQFEANVYAASCGLSVREKWTLDDVRAIPYPGTIEKIAREVFKLSGVEEGIKDMVESFREVAGGERTVSAPPGRRTPGKKPE
jgi:hypothetical protein